METPSCPREVSARPRRWKSIIILSACVLALLVIGLAWYALPIDARGIARYVELAQQASESPLAPLFALAAFVLGGLVVFPVNLLVAASIVIFGPPAGALYALLGSVLSAIVLFEIGRRLPESWLARLLGSRGERLRERIVGRGLLAVAFVRIVPLAPYSVVSLLAGVARIGRRDYIAGTALGMSPGIVLYALFADRAREVLRNPHPLAWLGLGLVVLVLIAFALGARIWLRKSPRAPQ